MECRVKIKYDGKLVTPGAMAKILGISPTAMWHRLRRGLPKEKLLAKTDLRAERWKNRKVENLYPVDMTNGKRTAVRMAFNGLLSPEQYLAMDGVENGEDDK